MRLRTAELEVLLPVVLAAYQAEPSAELAGVLQQLLTAARFRGMVSLVEAASAALQAGPLAPPSSARRRREPAI